jgi:hypothetical protein
MGTVEQLEREIAELAARMDVATHRLLTCIRQFDDSRAWAAQGALSCAYWLSWRIGLDVVTARERLRVAHALGKLPGRDAAMATGKLSYSKVRAISRGATPANEGTLVEIALAATGAQLERLCRGYGNALHVDDKPSREARSVRRQILPSGMVKVEMVLCPDEADLLFRALDRAQEVEHEATREEGGGDASAESSKREGHHDGCPGQPSLPSRADAVVALAETYLAGHAVTGNGGERFQVIVHVDQDPAAPEGVMAATLEDGTGIPAETLRRVACDAGIVATSGDPQTGLSIGRRSRSIPPAIRRALLLRDHGCRFPGCNHTRFLHGHHIQHWLHGGETSVENILTLCTRHHHLVHEEGWTLERGEDGGWQFAAPSGERLPSQPGIQVTGDTLTWLREWADEQGVDLGPDANYPQWDGSGMDYDLAVAGLMRENVGGG